MTRFFFSATRWSVAKTSLQSTSLNGKLKTYTKSTITTQPSHNKPMIRRSVINRKFCSDSKMEQRMLYIVLDILPTVDIIMKIYD